MNNFSRKSSMLKVILSISIIIISLSSQAVVRPNVDAFIAEKESFHCDDRLEVKTAFDKLIREDFKTQADLYKNILFLEALETLTEDQETLAQIQTALILGPSLGFTALGASYSGLASVISAFGVTLEMTLAEAAFFSVNFFMGAAITYTVSDNVVDTLRSIFGEDYNTDELLASMRVLASVDTKIINITNKIPELVRTGKYEQIVDKYVGWVSYNRYTEITKGLIELNKLLKLKAELIKSIKGNIRISCM